MRKLIQAGLLLYCLVAGWGFFIGRDLSDFWIFPWATGYLLLVIVVSYDAFFSGRPFAPFPLIILGILLLNFLVQVTGGVHSTIWPVYFIFAVMVAAFSPPRRAYAMVAVMLAIETANLVLSVPGSELAERWHVYAGFGLSLAAVSAAASHIMQRTRREVQEARDAHDRLIAGANAIDPLSGTPENLGFLDSGHRQKMHLRTAKNREITFNVLIDMIWGFVPAHTYALFLRERRNERELSVLRAIRSENSGTVMPIGHVLDPVVDGRTTEIDTCAEYRQNVVLPDMAGSADAIAKLGYYRTGSGLQVRSFLAIPIMTEDRTVAVLAIDSLEPGAFSQENRDMLEDFSTFFIQIIENIDLALQLKTRADHNRSLHNISVELGKSLWFGDIMRSVLPMLREAVPFDLCACVLSDEQDGRPMLKLAALAGYDESFLGRSFPLEDSSIIGHMRKHWQEQGILKYYTADFADRGRDIGLFPFKELQRPIRSMYGRLLVAKDTFLGAVFIASYAPDAFTDYHRDFLLDTLMNQVSQAAHNSLLYQRIESMARTDGLTGLLNHRTFQEKLREKCKELARTPRPFSVLLTDIDKFKGVNDKYGHPVGDIAIRTVARVLAETARASDFVARYGGEEFAVGMVDTDSKGAMQMAERLRKIMEQTVVTRVADGELKVTISIGVASCPGDTDDPTELVALADEALYHAKRSGRNRVSLHRDAVKNPLPPVGA